MSDISSDPVVIPPPPTEIKPVEQVPPKVEEKVVIPPPPTPLNVVPPPPNNTGRTDLPIGTLIWVKVEGYPWWPAKVVNENLGDEEMHKERIETDTNLVQFFGDNSIFWINCGDDGSCKVYEDHPTLMESYDGEYKEDLKKATTTLKRLFKRKKRKRENDLLLKEREKSAVLKKRKLDNDNNSVGLPGGKKKKKKKKRKRPRKDMKRYAIVGDMPETRLRDIFVELKKFTESDSVEEIKKILEELITHRVSMPQIISTKVGGIVNRLRNHKNEEISELSKRIVNEWKDVVKKYVE